MINTGLAQKLTGPAAAFVLGGWIEGQLQLSSVDTYDALVDAIVALLEEASNHRYRLEASFVKRGGGEPGAER